MQRSRKALLASVLALAACSEARTVDYYMHHRGEARQVTAACLAAGKAEPDCVNAASAMTRLGRQDFERTRAAQAKAIRDGSDRPTLGGKP